MGHKWSFPCIAQTLRKVLLKFDMGHFHYLDFSVHTFTYN
jgi:hypothetical protein